jgi:integrase/recombinase XerD
VSNELVGIDGARTPTAEQYSGLADVPPEVEWLANITNSTRSFHKKDVAEFLAFTGPQESSQIGKHATVARQRRHKLSVLPSLFDYLWSATEANDRHLS